MWNGLGKFQQMSFNLGPKESSHGGILATVYISLGRGDKVAKEKDQFPAFISGVEDRHVQTEGLLWVRGLGVLKTVQ